MEATRAFVAMAISVPGTDALTSDHATAYRAARSVVSDHRATGNRRTR
jgi:hypothetical protein